MPSNIFTHPFVKETTGRAAPIFSKAAEHVSRNRDREAEAQSENLAALSTVERYETQVVRRTFGLLNTIRALEDARRLISVFPSSLPQGPNAITRDRWVDYHYGYFTVSLASLPDIGLVLAATVTQLGLALKHCKADIVISHSSIRGTPVASALREVAKSVRACTERRHAHIHRGEQAEVDNLSEDTFLRDLKTLTLLQSVNPSLVDRSMLRGAWREATKAILPRLDEEVAVVEAALIQLFDSLLPQFTARCILLRELTDDPKNS